MKPFFFTIIVLSPGVVFAQDSSGDAGTASQDLLIGFSLGILLLTILVLIVLIYTLLVLRRALLIDKVKQETPEGEKIDVPPTLWEQIQSSLTQAVPVEKEEEIMFNHEYDGIRELDNHLPPWWKYLFYLTIAFAVIYVFVYHVIQVAPLQEEEYQREMARAEAAMEKRLAESGGAITADNVEFTDDPENIQNGQEIYMSNCAACHGPEGGGGVGPNLTDNYWIHGGSIRDIFSTIKNGVPQKGMIGWENQLSPSDIRDVTSYVVTLVGTSPANAKDPQGELYEPENGE